MVVRIPATPVALVLTIALGAGAHWLARWASLPRLPIALLPVCTAIGGFVATRWALRPPQVPGFAIGVLGVAVQLGLGLGAGRGLLAFVEPSLAVLEVVAAICGGLIGALLAPDGAAARASLQHALMIDPPRSGARWFRSR